jgi:RNA polymerase sigma factor (sigma-70 family)
MGVHVDNGAFTDTHPYARRAAKVHAARAVRAGFVHCNDREDLIQDALLGVWQQLRRFDAERASMGTFVERVVSSKLTSSVRKRRAAKRQTCELVIDVADLRNFAHEIEVRLDVEPVLDRLQPFDRMVATLLIDHTPTEAADALEITRSTVYRSISRVRSAFARAWDLAYQSRLPSRIWR